MTPTDLAARLLALDWSGVGLEHQIAVSAAVASLSQGAASLVVNYPHQPGSPWFDGSEAWECHLTQPLGTADPVGFDLAEPALGSNVLPFPAPFPGPHGSVTLPGGETEN
jgi:hypothetical protein